MATKCDGCNQRMDDEDGGAKVLIRDATPEFSLAATPPAYRRPPQIDLCARCLVKMIDVLGLPEDTFRPKPRPSPPVGALSDADLAALGLADDEVREDGAEDAEDPGVPNPGKRVKMRAPLGDPRTTDYCRKCGESPDSGSHLPHGHAYEDPRVVLEDEIKRLLTPYQTGAPDIGKLIK